MSVEGLPLSRHSWSLSVWFDCSPCLCVGFSFSCTKVYTLFSDVFYFVDFTMYCLLYLLDVFSFLVLSLKLHLQCVYEL